MSREERRARGREPFPLTGASVAGQQAPPIHSVSVPRARVTRPSVSHPPVPTQRSRTLGRGTSTGVTDRPQVPRPRGAGLSLRLRGFSGRVVPTTQALRPHQVSAREGPVPTVRGHDRPVRSRVLGLPPGCSVVPREPARPSPCPLAPDGRCPATQASPGASGPRSLQSPSLLREPRQQHLCPVSDLPSAA